MPFIWIRCDILRSTNLYCYTRNYLDLYKVCFERNVTAPNTLTSHKTIQHDRAYVTVWPAMWEKINRPSICDEIGPRLGTGPRCSVRDAWGVSTFKPNLWKMV